MPRIAISYRRGDAQAITGRIFDRLVAHYGTNSVFRDIDANIPLGVDFRDYINTMIAQIDVTLVVVGKGWFGAGERGQRRRIDNPGDPVRIEVETALHSGKPVVPVLVEGARMPNADDLPDSLKELVYRNGQEVDSGRDFDRHIERLIISMEPILRAARQAEEQRGRPEAERNQAKAARWIQTPQVFRAGDPVERSREAFVPRFRVIGELENQLMLATGCPGLILYGRRRTGKSTILRNLVGFLPDSVSVTGISMLDPHAFTSTESFVELLSQLLADVFTLRAERFEPNRISFFRRAESIFPWHWLKSSLDGKNKHNQNNLSDRPIWKN